MAAFLESYLIVLKYFDVTPNPPEDGAVRLKQIQQFGAKLFKRQEIVRKEALSKINYLNAVDFYQKAGLNKTESGEGPTTTIDSIRRYMKHLPL